MLRTWPGWVRSSSPFAIIWGLRTSSIYAIFETWTPPPKKKPQPNKKKHVCQKFSSHTFFLPFRMSQELVARSCFKFAANRKGLYCIWTSRTSTPRLLFRYWDAIQCACGRCDIQSDQLSGHNIASLRYFRFQLQSRCGFLEHRYFIPSVRLRKK